MDLKRGWINLPRSKTGKPISIPIIPPLRDVLEREPGRRKGLVCGRLPKDPSHTAALLRKLLEDARIPKAPRGQGGWHRFRHSCGTILADLGVPHAVVARILAHSPAMAARYIHPDDRAVKDAMERLAEAWEGQAR